MIKIKNNIHNDPKITFLNTSLNKLNPEKHTIQTNINIPRLKNSLLNILKLSKNPQIKIKIKNFQLVILMPSTNYFNLIEYNV